jgi:hypothetical protein
MANDLVKKCDGIKRVYRDVIDYNKVRRYESLKKG